jgi:hypothetical protein
MVHHERAEGSVQRLSSRSSQNLAAAIMIKQHST